MDPNLAATVESTIAASPNRQRIRALADKLTGLSDELGHEKQARADAVELKLKVTVPLGKHGWVSTPSTVATVA